MPKQSAGAKFRAAAEAEKPPQVVGTISAYYARRAYEPSSLANSITTAGTVPSPRLGGVRGRADAARTGPDNVGKIVARPRARTRSGVPARGLPRWRV